jgi:hypothetical protein
MENTVPTDTDLLNEDVVVEASFNDSSTLSTNTERIDVISQKIHRHNTATHKTNSSWQVTSRQNQYRCWHPM